MKSKDISPLVTIEMAEDRHMVNSNLRNLDIKLSEYQIRHALYLQK